MANDVWVYIEHKEGETTPMSFELLGIGKTLATELGSGLCAFVIGQNVENAAKEAFAFARRLDFVDSICVGMKSPAEVEMNVRLMEGRPVPKKILAQVETVPRRLRINRFCKGCGACVETCDQGALSVDLSQADPSEGKKGHAVVDKEKCILCAYCAEACPDFCIRVV
jgi:NAD-dependent dihydropyrimidine dehydrogenase PreA subunit